MSEKEGNRQALERRNLTAREGLDLCLEPVVVQIWNGYIGRVELGAKLVVLKIGVRVVRVKSNDFAVIPRHDVITVATLCAVHVDVFVFAIRDWPNFCDQWLSKFR